MKQFENFWDRKSLKSKLLLITIPTSIISSMLMLIFGYYIFSRYEEKMYQIARQNLRLVVTKMENELIEAEELGMDLITNETVQKALKSEQTNIRTKRIAMDYIRMAQQVYKVMQSSLAKNRDVFSISIFVEDEWYYVGNANRSYDASLLEQVQFDPLKNQNGMLWCAANYPTRRLYGIRSIKDIYHGTFQNEAVLVMEFDLEGSINSALKRSLDTSFAQEFAIYNGEAVIYSDISLNSGMEWEKDFDHKIVAVDKKRYFAAYLNESDFGWKYVFLVDYNDLFGAMQLMKYAFFFFALCMTGISMIYCHKLSLLITNRFDWLLGRMRTVQRGSFSVEQRAPLETQDEIGMVCQQFEDMVAALNKLIHDNYVKQMLIQENQLKVLQNQINPHFLFNTLQTINWKAKEKREKEISEIAEALGKLLRYTLKEDNDPAKLSKEVEVLKNYLFIQQVRYGERLSVCMEIPKDMKDKEIPKLSLQNLVENSIKHALENMLKPCVITICARYTDKGYEILVEDNGPGIRKEFRGEQTEDPEKCAGLGIGLKNIQGRLQLLFSQDSSLEIRNTGHGTLAKMEIQKREYEDGETEKEGNSGR